MEFLLDKAREEPLYALPDLYFCSVDAMEEQIILDKLCRNDTIGFDSFSPYSAASALKQVCSHPSVLRCFYPCDLCCF